MTQSRRKFLSELGAFTVAGLASTRRGWAAGQDDPKPSRPTGAAADIRIAVVGIRSRGRDHIAGFGPGVTAVCDVDQKVLHQQGDFAAEQAGHAVQRFTDYRRMLDEADIDAVSIATPNHTHALIAIAACQAGKHVYVEKPVSHNVWEGQQLVNAAAKYDRLIQAGMQSRSSYGIREAVEFVRNGGLGPIRYAVGTCYKPRASIGKLDRPLKIPDTIDYDLWCGPAAKVELFRPQLHYDWHWDFNTGCGDIGNQGVHQMDIARWFLGESQLAPRVISIGGRLGYDDAGNTPNTQVVVHDYPAAPLVFETRGLPRSSSEAKQGRWQGKDMDEYLGSRVGAIVVCERGRVLIPNYVEAFAFDERGEQIEHWHGADDHYHNFLEAIVAGDRLKLNADILDGHISSALCHTGNISHQLGQTRTPEELDEIVGGHELLADSFQRMKAHLQRNEIDPSELTVGPWLSMDPNSERFVDNDQANNRLTREYRKPFTITAGV